MQESAKVGEVELPLFSKIETKTICDDLKTIIDNNLQSLEKQLKREESFTWKNLAAPIEEREDALRKFWSPISHLNSVCNNSELRVEHDKALKILSDYYTKIGQNQKLYDAYTKLAESAEFENLDRAKKSAINHALRDFRLSGVHLEKSKRARFSEIKSKLSNLSSTFSNNVIDATQAWCYQTSDVEELKGLPDVIIQGALEASKNKKHEGYTLTLDGPIYIAVLSYADNIELRKAFYEAYCTRASDQGPNAGKWDNSPLIKDILSLRQELASLLDKQHYAELSLEKKMANGVVEVEDFLRELANKARKLAEEDLIALRQFAKDNYGVETLNPWDIAYYSEKLKQKKYDVSQEELRKYFTLSKVKQGLFEVAEKLFSIEIKKSVAPDLWHSSVEYYEIFKGGRKIAGFYMDLYTREGKRGGAWMDVCVTRRKISATKLQLPVAYLVCNFNPPVGEQDALLTHNDVTTLFHECGHGLHHMLTEIDVAAVSGIDGVEWDAVELPSQFLENWAWQPEVLKNISSHVDSGEAISDELITKMLNSKSFQKGLFLLRQIEFGLFDLLVHKNFGSENFNSVQETLNAVRNEVAVLLPPEYNRFQNGFTHIFSGGYSAGYYSYLWAEVLSADAFSAFEKEGIFSEALGNKFLQELLSQGGSASAAELFESFRGRSPDSTAFLKHCGIA